MKKIIKESTTITEMIVDNNGKTFIVNRKYKVDVSTEPLDKSNFLSSEEEIYQGWAEKDEYFRQEIAKEAEEYKKKNPLPQTEKELPDTSNQKRKQLEEEAEILPDTSMRKEKILEELAKENNQD